MKTTPFVSSAGPGRVFQDPFVDIPPVMGGGHTDLDRKLMPLEFSPSDHDRFGTQSSQHSLDTAGI